MTTQYGRPAVRIYKRIALTFIGITLVLLGVVLAATIARARIVITAREVPVTAETKVNVAGETMTSETVRGTVITTTARGEGIGKPAGSGKTVEAQATGTVMLVNKRSVGQPLVATTRLLTPDGVLFRLRNGVVIPGNGELKDVPVYADQIGAASEIGPSNFTVPGLSASLQELVYAFSEKPMTGGLRVVRSVSPEDLDAAAAAVTENLVKNAIAGLADEVARSGYAGIAVDAKEISRSASVKPGDSTDSFTVSVALAVTAVLFDREKLANIGESALRANLGEDVELRSSNADTVEPTVQTADAATDTATLAVTFSGGAILNRQSPLLAKNRLVGLDADTIKAYLKSFESIADVEVSFSPFWVRRAPRLFDHIEITIR